MYNHLIAGLIVLSASNTAKTIEPSFIAAKATVSAHVLLVENKDDRDPGKDITDNPHGPNPHGRDPHGPDPYDEVHDKRLPANDPDSYYRYEDRSSH